VDDWNRWHTHYDDPGSSLSQRLAAVQEQIGLALDRARPGPLAVLSLCAGQGRDVLPVLARHPRGGDVRGRLVELDPRLAAAAREAAPPGVEVVEGDAGSTAAAAGVAPVDLLLLCGIFGNVGEDDIATTVAAVPALLAPGGTVIWTRGTRAPDLTARVRSWFAAAGVRETSFVTGPRPGWSVGAGVLDGPTRALEPDRRLFTFLGGGPG
jgi:hypothetical protein